jgi:hypothetical protein
VSHGTLGERYFATRQRLSGLSQGILDLAGQCSAPPPEPLATGGGELGKPFRIIACGEVNAGKSSLLNSLCGQPLCPTGVLPVTDRFHHYRHGGTKRDLQPHEQLEENIRPLDFLANFELIDTPGIHHGRPEHLEMLAQLVREVDLVLCVFPVANPWTAACWDFIGGPASEFLDRLALVIQQADQREPGDLDVILGHVADLSRKRLGRALPAFAVSASHALEAKRGSTPDERRLRSSGLPQLEQFISEKICLSPARRELLETWRGHAVAALRALDDHIEEQNRGISGHTRFVAGLDREIEEIREEFIIRLPSHLTSVAEVFQSEASEISRLLHRRLRALPSLLRLFTGDHTGQQIETAFIQRLQDTIEAVAAKDGDEVAKACSDHWTKLVAQVKEMMHWDLQSAAPIDETLAAARGNFIKRLGSAASQGVGNLKVRNRLDKDLRRRNLALRAFTITTLLLTTAGGVCGALGLPWLPILLCGLAALFLAGGVLVAWLTRRTITREFRARLLDTCGAFAATLHSDYADALGEVFRSYHSALDPLHRHLAREKSAIEPRLRRWQELFLTLKAIEQDW